MVNLYISPTIKGLSIYLFNSTGKVLVLPLVKVKDNEYFDYALRRFKRACEKAGIVNEYRKREFYEKPTQEKKRKKAAAVKRERKRVTREHNRSRRLY